MSVVVWDGQRLVADTYAEYDKLQLKRTKVFQINSYTWAGFTGCTNDWWRVKEWLERGKADPVPEGSLDFNAIIVRKMPEEAKAQVTFMGDAIHEVPIVHPFVAIGAGAIIAMTALHLGNSAISSARVACDMHSQCAEPLTIFTVVDDDIPFC